MKRNFIFYLSYIFGRLFGRRSSSIETSSCGEATNESYLVDPNPADMSYQDNEKPEACDVYNSQIAAWADNFNVNRKVGNVACSDPDYLNGTGEVAATYKITPLHAFDDQAGHGDYYIVDGTFTISNAKMYQPNHTNMHGWVHVRIGGFCLTNCDIDVKLYDKNGKIDGVKAFSSSPLPETVIQEKTYTINDGWNIGGSVTGGIAGGNSSAKGKYLEGSGQVSFNWGVSHSKSESYKISDLTIRNNSNVDNVGYSLVNNNVVGFDWGCDHGLSDCADFAKSSLIFHASWIWYIPGAKDMDTTNKMTIKTTMKPKYKSCRFYSTKADYDEWYDEITKTGYADLELPNRQPTGIVTIANDTDETISNVKLIDKNGKVAYESTSSFLKGTEAKFCMPTGKYTIWYMRGKTAKEMVPYQYATAETFSIERGKTLNLVATFDFEQTTKTYHND